MDSCPATFAGLVAGAALITQQVPTTVGARPASVERPPAIGV
jgi:hypothetical protein